MSKNGIIYVRYLYATEKGLKALTTLDEGSDEFIIQRIPKEWEVPPLPPMSFTEKHWVKGETRV